MLHSRRTRAGRTVRPCATWLQTEWPRGLLFRGADTLQHCLTPKGRARCNVGRHIYANPGVPWMLHPCFARSGQPVAVVENRLEGGPVLRRQRGRSRRGATSTRPGQRKVRGSSAQKGPLWLGEKGDIYGRAVIDRLERVSSKEASRPQEQLHKVRLSEEAELPYKKTWLRHLQDIAELDTPIPYANKADPVTWLKYSKPKPSERGA